MDCGHYSPVRLRSTAKTEKRRESSTWTSRLSLMLPRITASSGTTLSLIRNRKSAGISLFDRQSKRPEHRPKRGENAMNRRHFLHTSLVAAPAAGRPGCRRALLRFDRRQGTETCRGDMEAAIPGPGLGCFLAAPATRLGKDFDQFLTAQAATNSRFDGNSARLRRETRLVPVAPAPRLGCRRPVRWLFVRPAVPSCSHKCGSASAARTIPTQTMKTATGIPTPSRSATSNGVSRCSLMQSTKHRSRTPTLQAFLKATNYRPGQPENFLKHWDRAAARRKSRPPCGVGRPR